MPRWPSEPRVCAIGGCSGKHYAKGWCNKHWNRWRKHGDPNLGARTIRLCSITGCERKHARNGYCNMHDRRNKKYGDPHHKTKTWNGELKQWLQDVALNYTSDECLPWPFCRISGGYGRFKENGKAFSANRWVCEQEHGPPPTDEHEAAHSCGSAWCMNRKHLRWATPKENCADKIGHGTATRGERSPSSKLTELQVLQIRMLKGTMTQTKIAMKFGIANQTVSQIMLRQSWGWLHD